MPLEERVHRVIKVVLRSSGTHAVLAIRINAGRVMKTALRAVMALMVMACLAFGREAKHTTTKDMCQEDQALWGAEGRVSP
jgi:hypothetical protein